MYLVSVDIRAGGAQLFKLETGPISGDRLEISAQEIVSLYLFFS
jgi:hypothetical protein